MDDATADSTTPARLSRPAVLSAFGERVIATCGYLLVIASVASFGAIAFLKVKEARADRPVVKFTAWLDLIQHETSTITFILIGIVAAVIGKRLLTSAQLADARTIPYEDLPLIKQAVIDGNPQPIDQYVRLRSLSGMSGNFTKLGITGLPLTTVLLTLIFALLAVTLETQSAKEFLDLAKLTLGAFIGSFVQRQVEQRRDNGDENGGSRRSFPSLPA